MKNFLLIICLLFYAKTATPEIKQDDFTAQLSQAMKIRDQYDSKKERRISNLKKESITVNLSIADQYLINHKIYEEYKKYIIDSAIHYVVINKELAEHIGDEQLVYKSTIELAALYSTNGMYIESKELLDNINVRKLSSKLIPLYYESYGAFYSHYGQSNNVISYFNKSELYRDSLLTVLPKESLKYQISYATKQLYAGETREAKKLLLALLEKTRRSNHQYATIAYFLGLIYKEEGNLELQKKYFSLSAISDVENSTKDNASLQALALTYYSIGDIDHAYMFMEAALNDAIFCSVRYRTIENSSFYPIINASFQEKENYKKSILRSYLTLISVLSAFLFGGIIYIYLQMNKLSKIKKELDSKNTMLIKLNEDLKNTNNRLFEADHIKEEYIAHFFYICSSYIDKIEKYRNSLYKKAINNQFSELTKELKSTNLAKTELEELYKNFDIIFLNLYPSFVEEFNKLLAPNEAVLPKSGDLLNTELRIFALIRLGITDSVKISTFLRYSLQTVYNYRTKVRNKAAVSRNELEEKVKQIGTLSLRK